ncbi:MAG: hypothetical protein GTN76_02060 [Candidatus Aenigmarchaeota archaeon]|nr:hypothetical protein [Candidatus Aenigmarchaeota archaeon]
MAQPVTIGDLHFEPDTVSYGDEETLYLNLTNLTLLPQEFLIEIKIDYSIWPYLFWIPIYESDYLDWFLFGDMYLNISVGYPILVFMPPGRYRFTLTIGNIGSGIWDKKTDFYDVTLLPGEMPEETDVGDKDLEEVKAFFQKQFKNLFGN